MARIYFLGGTNSDLTGGADWNKYLETAAEVGGTQAASTAARRLRIADGLRFLD